MQPLRSLEMWPLRIPLKVAFKHASASRAVTDSIWVEAADGSGVTGYGEACPRTYVTREDSESCLRFFSRWRDDLLRQIRSPLDLEQWGQAHRQEIDLAPAAWCAIELSILDLAARTVGTSIEALLRLPELTADFQYTAILGDQDDASFTSQLERYLHWGFPSFKVKLSRDPARNQAKMA
ncbi:MAG: hypothetical protein EXS31_10565 [Pedosphaera sp.]|nr:hypothetical protein [Pedosphaera sp.]